MKRENNNRKYPGESGARPDNAKFRREEAIERQVYYDNLSIEDKIAKLGKHVAMKQRAKLAADLERRNNGGAKAQEVREQPIAEGSDGKEHKHLKAKDRRKQEKK
jgi:hypothetical protein